VAEKNGASSKAEVTASRQGLTVAEYHAKNLKKTAQRQGFSTVTEYLNSKHPYRQHRKDRCENRDGRLGFKCNYKIRHSAQLQVDHIDGDHTNNDPGNLQTLCANCHTFKTHSNGDTKTPGRKTRTKIS
jgi:5-methylcytosine-specific restriction endonuclease McrA